MTAKGNTGSCAEAPHAGVHGTLQRESQRGRCGEESLNLKPITEIHHINVGWLESQLQQWAANN